MTPPLELHRRNPFAWTLRRARCIQQRLGVSRRLAAACALDDYWLIARQSNRAVYVPATHPLTF